MNHCNILPFLAVTAALIFSNCANQKQAQEGSLVDKKKEFHNPYPEGTYDHFKADPSYPKTYDVWRNEAVMERTNASNSYIKIDLAKQRGFLMNGQEVALDYPICSGTKDRPTPKGTFRILEKLVDKKSNRYGRILDANGDCVNSNADALKDPIPEGGKFVGAEMRYWMRLTGDGVGHHIGPVRRYPASHACVRGPSKIIPIVYGKVRPGTRVEIH